MPSRPRSLSLAALCAVNLCASLASFAAGAAGSAGSGGFDGSPGPASPAGSSADAPNAKEQERRMREGKEHFQAGQLHYSLGEFTEAVAEFREAYRLRPEAPILFNIAQAMRQMNDYRHAYFYYSQYLSKRPDAANRSAVEEFMIAMKKRMDEEDSLKAAQAGPTVPGETAAPDKGVPDKGVPDKGVPDKGDRSTVTVVDANAAGAASAADAHSDEPAPAVAVVALTPPPPSLKGKSFWTAPHIGGVAAAGVGLGAGALAFVFHSSAQSSADTLNQKYSSGTLTTQDASLKDDVDSKGQLATICLISGAVLLAAGGVLAFVF